MKYFKRMSKDMKYFKSKCKEMKYFLRKMECCLKKLTFLTMMYFLRRTTETKYNTKEDNIGILYF